MDISLKRRVLFESIALVIILSLCAAILIHGKDLSCDKCTVKFKQTRAYGSEIENATVYTFHPDFFYDNLINNTCKFSWDRSKGYTYLP